jgi:hypothetical protein
MKISIPTPCCKMGTKCKEKKALTEEDSSNDASNVERSLQGKIDGGQRRDGRTTHRDGAQVNGGGEKEGA